MAAAANTLGHWAKNNAAVLSIVIVLFAGGYGVLRSLIVAEAVAATESTHSHITADIAKLRQDQDALRVAYAASLARIDACLTGIQLQLTEIKVDIREIRKQ